MYVKAKIIEAAVQMTRSKKAGRRDKDEEGGGGGGDEEEGVIAWRKHGWQEKAGRMIEAGDVGR